MELNFTSILETEILIRNKKHHNRVTSQLLMSVCLGLLITGCNTSEQERLLTYCDAIYNCGYISSAGEIIIPAQFEQVLPFNDSTGLASVKTGREWRDIDKEGNLLSIQKYPRSQHYLGRIHVRTYKGKAGVFSASGKKLNPTDFDQVILPKIDGNPIRVQKVKKWGLLNTEGQIITPFLYDFIYDFEAGGTATVKIKETDHKNKFGVINKFGKITVPVKYDSLSGFNSRHGAYDAELSVAKLNEKYGYINRQGKMVIPNQFDDAQRFRNGRAVVHLDGKKGLIDTTGKIIAPIKFDDLWHFGAGFPTIKLNGKWGYIDFDGRMVIAPEFDKPGGVLSEGELAHVYLDHKWGYMDQTGKMVIPAQYERALHFSDNNLARVKLNGKWGFINQTGKMVIPNEYDDLNPNKGSPLIRAYENGKWGLIDYTGKTIIPIEYDEVGGSSASGVFLAKNNDKIGLILEGGEILIPFEYDEIRLHDEGNLITVEKGNKVGLIDIEGKIIVPIIFDKATPFRVEWDGKSYPIKQDGTPIGFSYDDVGF